MIVSPSREDKTGPAAAHGFSLVELMVAMAISLVLMAGVVAIFLSSRTTYETTDRLSRIQESGRFALDMLVRDLRSAGYLGCSRRAGLTNTLNNATSPFWDFATPVYGFDAQGSAWLPVLDTSAGGVAPGASTTAGADVIVIRLPRPTTQPVRVIALMADTTDAVQIANTTPLPINAGDIVQVSDCSGRAVFQVTSAAGGVLQHGAGAGTPGNLSADLEYAFTTTAELVPLQSVAYYLADGSTPGAGTSLWRKVGGPAAAEELVEGVEQLQILYGRRNGNEVQYLRADEVGANWGEIVTVRVALLVRSLSAYGTDTDQEPHNLLGTDVPAPGDRQMRQVFTTTVNIRNNAI